MLYQKLLLDSAPYVFQISNGSAFEVHRHPEFEISCCLAGTYDLICENRRYTLQTGDFAIIPPMAAHEIPEGNDAGCCSVTIELGSVFLGAAYKPFLNQNRQFAVYEREKLGDTSFYREISALLEETAVLHPSSAVFRELSIKGNLYKISALLLQGLPTQTSADLSDKRSDAIRKIDKAIEIIYNRYYEPLSIEMVSTSCGYSKSNFCRIFKNVVGETFHHTLNRHRVEIACTLLRESDHAIEKIARETGFPDVKTFCRVFKKLVGTAAGEYRKQASGG